MGVRLATGLSTSGKKIFRAFDLFADFNVPNFDASNEDVLGPAQGVQKGSLTVVKTGGGGSSVGVESEKLKLVGDNTTYEATSFVGNAITKALGKAMFVTQGASASVNSRFGFDESATSDGNPDNHYLRRAAANEYSFVFSGGFDAVVADITNTTDYQFLMLMGGADSNGIPFKVGDTVADFIYGMRVFIKGGAFTAWTLLAIDVNDNTSTLYPQFNMFTAGQSTTFDNIYIPPNVLNVDTMFNPAFLSTSTDESDHDTGVSDFIMEVVFTTPGSGTDPLDIRYRKAGTNDNWLIRITPGTEGTDIEIIQNAGGEVQRASADIDWSTSTEYRVTIIVDGDDHQFVYVDGVLKLEYTTTNTFNETETTIDLLKNSFTVSMVAVHNRTKAAWDTLITAETGEVY